jgi:glycerophosphoryl diester phosphodiesterase
MDWTLTGQPLRIGGHRGAPDVTPENTLVSFQAALDVGTEYVEMDVRRSSDGHLVVLHDARVERTTDGRGRASQLTLAQLQGLDASKGSDPRFAGTRIPSFAEFMAWMEAHPGFGAVIEAKAEGVAADIARAIVASPSRPHLAICSFRKGEILAAKRAEPSVPCVLLFHSDTPSGDPVKETRSCRADGADLPWQWLTKDIAADMRAAGLLVGGGTANDEASVRRLVEVGADFVDSDRPGVAVQARNALARAR